MIAGPRMRLANLPAGRCGIRLGVSEHLVNFATALGASDRAALQSLIPLASGLGAGTIFGLFFVGRRRAGFAVFETVAIVAVLVCVAATSYYAIALLHRDTAITNKELVATAVPLVIAAVLLILISVVARLRGATQRLSVLLPLVLVAVVATVELGSSGIAIEATAAPVVALVILAGGAGFGALGALLDSRARRAARTAEQDRLAHLTGRGYVLAEAALTVALPRLAGESGAGPSRPDGADDTEASGSAGLGGPTIDVWRRGDASFIDGPGAARLRALVDGRWQSLAAGEARGPLGPAVLLEAELAGGSRGAPAELRLSILRPGTEHPRQEATLAANPDGLFDVSELVG